MACTLPPTAQVGVAYTGANCAASGGTTPYTYSITAGALPPGLTLDSATGDITGMPTTAGNAYSFTVTGTDSSTPTALSGDAVIPGFTVAPPTLTLSCTLPPTAQVGVAYTGSELHRRRWHDALHVFDQRRRFAQPV